MRRIPQSTFRSKPGPLRELLVYREKPSADNRIPPETSIRTGILLAADESHPTADKTAGRARSKSLRPHDACLLDSFSGPRRVPHDGAHLPDPPVSRSLRVWLGDGPDRPCTGDRPWLCRPFRWAHRPDCLGDAPLSAADG